MFDEDLPMGILSTVTGVLRQPGHPMPTTTRADSSEHVMNVAVDVALRLALLTLIAASCFIVVRPFLVVLVWATIIAVAFAAPFEGLVRLTGRRGLAATLVSITAIVLVVLPTYHLGESLLRSVGELRTSLAAGELTVPPPPQRLVDLPLIGDRLVDAWALAADNTQAAVRQFEPQLRELVRWGLGFLTGIGGAVLQTLVAIVIATALLTYREGATRTVGSIARRMNPSHGEEFVNIAAATVNSVALGVVGVALLQAGAAGLLLTVASFPWAAVVTVAVLALAIAQLPVNLALLWPIVWSFSEMSTPLAVAFTVTALLIGFSDAPLKPLFLGRGVPIPTLVILIGALGGMVALGIMGLFIGAIILGLGWRLLMAWVETGSTEIRTEPS
jgi:predicted PurR-regulated permease PerM